MTPGEDDGSCEFCPCDYYKNPDYDAERQCGEQCLPYDDGSEDDEDEEEEEECSLCDVVQNATGEVTLNINASSMTTGGTSAKSAGRSGNASSTPARSIAGNSGEKRQEEKRRPSVHHPRCSGCVRPVAFEQQETRKFRSAIGEVGRKRCQARQRIPADQIDQKSN